MRILFICRGNVARSQEAAAYYNQLAGTDVAVSAGIEAVVGKPIHPLVIQVMAEDGIDMASAFRKPLLALPIAAADHIVSFVPLTELPDSAQAKAVYWDVVDPRGTDLQNHRHTRDVVKHLVEEFYAHHR